MEESLSLVEALPSQQIDVFHEALAAGYWFLYSVIIINPKPFGGLFGGAGLGVFLTAGHLEPTTPSV